MHIVLGGAVEKYNTIIVTCLRAERNLRNSSQTEQQFVGRLQPNGPIVTGATAL